MIVIINKNTNAGNGLNKWRKIEGKFVGNEINFTSNLDEAEQVISNNIKASNTSEKQVVIAAGGDGTANGILNYIMSNSLQDKIILGAIGLGSSNDFHKPFKKENFINGIPVMINKSSPQKVDVVKATIKNATAEVYIKYFVINCSVGITAEGNAFFNSNNGMLKILKPIHVEVANMYTIFNVLMSLKAVNARLQFFDHLTKRNVDENFVMTNLGILKKSNVSGGMKYDTPVTADDGMLDITMFLDITRFALIKGIVNLYKGIFLGQANTYFARSNKIKIILAQEENFETDGEISKAKEVEIEVLPKCLEICG